MQAMNAFVMMHPCEVFDGEGNFHSRYTSMECGAWTVYDMGCGKVRVSWPESEPWEWDHARCCQAIKEIRQNRDEKRIRQRICQEDLRWLRDHRQRSTKVVKNS